MATATWKWTPLLVLLLVCGCAHGWDSDEMEVFDVVEEVNENFYQLIGVSQDATVGEIKKAYRRMSLQLHPDKNDAPDADVQFRNLVSVYEVLRDEGKREAYNKVLVEGLPDWRSAVYYYRRARKMSLLEISVILTVVISITQYLMAWGTYIDQKHTMEEFLVKKYKVKDRRKKKQEDLENIALMEEELDGIPRPSWRNVLPVQLGKLVIFLVTGGPGVIRGVIAVIQEEKEKKRREKEEEEEEERRAKEEEEKKKAKKASRKECRKKVKALPDYSNGGCILEAVDGSESDSQQPPKPVKPAAPVYSGPWTEDDFNDLAKLMGKFPGGTVDRWEKIAEAMERSAYEVTRMSSKVKNLMMKRTTEQPSEETVPELKVKVKTKAEKIDLSAGSDEMWNPVQQKALEKALKQFPKGTDQRWDKIAKTVPDKFKEDCMLRFKFLAEKIKKKKVEGVEKHERGGTEDGQKDSEVEHETDLSEGCDTREGCETLHHRMNGVDH